MTRSHSLAPLAALCLIARLHHVTADPARIAHQLGWPSNHAPDIGDLLRAAEHIGLRAILNFTRVEHLQGTPLPALALLDTGPSSPRVVVLARYDDQRVLLQDPAEDGPYIELLSNLRRHWSGTLILISSALASDLHDHRCMPVTVPCTYRKNSTAI